MNAPAFSVVVDVLRELRVNFPGKRDGQDIQKQAEVYLHGLTGISADSLRHAVRRSIQEDTFFPKVSRLRELAAGYEAHERAIRPPSPADELRCPQCGEEYHAQRRYRPYFGRTDTGDLDYRRGWLTSADGAWLLLEPFDRTGCRCSSRAHHIPHPDMDPPCEQILPKQWLPVPTTRSTIEVRAV